MRLLFRSSVAAYAGLLGLAAALVPDRVPLHFGPGGDPDRWGSRTELLLVLGGAGLLLAACFGLSARAVDRANLSSSWWNLPHKDWWTATPERERVARDRLRADMLGIGAATMGLLAVVLASVVVAARGDDPSLGPATMVAIGALVVGLVVWSLWMSLHRYRPPQD